MVGKPFVFFDLGGTLVDLRGIVACMAGQLRASRVRGPVLLALRWATATAERLPDAQRSRFQPEREIAADVLGGLLETRGREKAREESTRLVWEAWDEFVRTCTLQPDVTASWLRELKNRLAGLGLVTDGDSEAVAGVLAHLGVRGLFDSVTISEEVGAYKPNPRIYRAALKALRAKPSQTLFVADAAIDLQGAAELGMGVAWIRRGLFPDLTKPPRGTLVLTDLRDVDRIVKRYPKSGRFALR